MTCRGRISALPFEVSIDLRMYLTLILCKLRGAYWIFCRHDPLIRKGLRRGGIDGRFRVVAADCIGGWD